MKKKQCIYCKRVKSTDMFFRSKKNKSGYFNACKTCNRLKTNMWIKQNKDAFTKGRRKYRKDLKHKVLVAYGGKCNCCGESGLDFLTIDHINNDGNKERKERPQTGMLFYHWLVKNSFPKSNYQVLCFNCNCGKNINGGICPHKEMSI